MSINSDRNGEDNNDILEEYGIRRVLVDYFHVGGYRYTNIEDAMAQARRSRGRSKPMSAWSAPRGK